MKGSFSIDREWSVEERSNGNIMEEQSQEEENFSGVLIAPHHGVVDLVG